MGQSKIKSVQANGTYQSKFDGSTMYAFEVELEDGILGDVSAKTEDRWKAGDEVEYTLTTSPYGKKLKLTKPDFKPFNSNFSRKPDLDTQKRIENSWALQTAIKMLGVLEGDRGVYLSEVNTTALMLLKMRDKLSEEVQEVVLDDSERPSASKWTETEIDAMDLEAEKAHSPNSLPF